MSVKLIDNEAFYGFRVRRTVDGRLYQEYFSLKRAGKRLGVRRTRAVERVAQARDDELRLEQEKCKRKRKAERCFHPDGRVKGISYLIKTEKSGTKTPIFQIGIASELERKIICTSYSINAHGLEQAWAKAVRAYARHKKISRSSDLYAQLMAAMPAVDLPEGAGIKPAPQQRGSRPAERRAAAATRSRRVATGPAGNPVRRAATTKTAAAARVRPGHKGAGSKKPRPSSAAEPTD